MNKDREYTHRSTKGKSTDASVANDEDRHDKQGNSVDRHRSRDDRERSEDSYERDRREKLYEMEGDFWSRRSSKRKERVKSEDDGGDDQRVRVSDNRVKKEVDRSGSEGDCVEVMVKKEQVDSPRPGSTSITDMSGFRHDERGKRSVVDDDPDLQNYSGRLYNRCVPSSGRRRRMGQSIPRPREVSQVDQTESPSLQEAEATERRLHDVSPTMFRRPSSSGKGLERTPPFKHSYQRHGGEEEVDVSRGRRYEVPLSRGGRVGRGLREGILQLRDDDEEVEEEEEDRGRRIGASHPPLRGGRGSPGSRGYPSVRPREEPSFGWGRGHSGAMLTESYPGGPHISDVLTCFDGHVAYAIWNGEERGVLKYQTQTERIATWAKVNMQNVEHIVSTNLLHLRENMFSHFNMPLISAFVERWHLETNSFHMPFGELTVTLHDVWHILRIPVTGKALISKMSVGVVKIHLEKLLGMTTSEVNAELKSSSIRLTTLTTYPHNTTMGYLLWLLGSTLFVDKSQTRVSIHYLPFLLDLVTIPSYAWGAATLAFLYRHLGMASRAKTLYIAGCMTLLEAWIYEYFPTFRPAKKSDWKPHQPASLKWVIGQTRQPYGSLLEYRRTLDKLTSDMVSWTPFGKDPCRDVPITLFRGIIHCRHITENYLPERCLRQFGYVQTIPRMNPNKLKKESRGANPAKYVCVHDPDEDLWNGWQFYRLTPRDVAHYPDQAEPAYMQWFIQRTHPRVTPTYLTNEDDDGGITNMPPEARLQWVASRMQYTQASYRHNLSEEELLKLIDDVNAHLSDLFSFHG